jgi:hypothetical protein
LFIGLPFRMCAGSGGGEKAADLCGNRLAEPPMLLRIEVDAIG